MSGVFPRSEFSACSIHQATVTVPRRAITDVALHCTGAITTTYLAAAALAAAATSASAYLPPAARRLRAAPT